MNAPSAFPDQQKPVPPYKHTPLFPLGADTTPYKKVTSEGVRVEKVLGKDMLVVSREALRALSEAAFGDINHYLRPGHLKQLRSILEDKEASDNDKFVAFDFLKNANIAAGGVLPMCQDTGTAIIMGKKGCNVITDGDDEAALSEGARDAYLRRNLRYSQVAPLSMYEEKNTANNMPAQCEIYAEGDDAYKFMFMAKGGGSANKSFLFQATPSVLTKDRLLAFLKEKVLTLGTAACPPYHLAIVIGGTSAELCMKTVKLASARYLDALPTHGSADGNAFRDLEMEQEILKMTQSLGVGAQFGGKYFCHDVRVIRMPRHGASRPFDGEGLATAPRMIVEGGVLQGWTLDLATARKLGMESTANAVRGTSSAPSPGVTNVALTAGTASPRDLIRDMGRGLVVTSMLGASVNATTGDYSRGAAGFWVENGEIAFPVNECTIAGNLREMLMRITAANDLPDWRSLRVPSLLVEGMTVAGS